MAKHRTPQQLLREALQRVEDLKLKSAQAMIADDPRMKSLMDKEQVLKKELTKSLKWLDPEKGLSARIKKLQAQIEEAESNLKNATEIRKDIRAQLETIDTKKRELSEELDVSILMAEM